VAARASALWATSSGVFRIEVDRDGFTAEAPITLNRDLRRVTFTLRNRRGDRRVELKPNASADWQRRRSFFQPRRWNRFRRSITPKVVLKRAGSSPR